MFWVGVFSRWYLLLALLAVDAHGLSSVCILCLLAYVVFVDLCYLVLGIVFSHCHGLSSRRYGCTCLGSLRPGDCFNQARLKRPHAYSLGK